ncbi:hypothetical protein KVR01_011686 [Diaporthe batatas]|uniref:uncharacterized protein n=1 Tax=Diaporthe batatas TaxID=748121 RepID=UPI001D041CB3|nr:uncharacterized protein KVR01_011686 [Diaporthe batatas]KAG8158564.1 hypothetical protein KVR01_011686 [Diaporthe batatas]
MDISFHGPSATNWDCRNRQWRSYSNLFKTPPEARAGETVYSTVSLTPTEGPPEILSPTSVPSPSNSLPATDNGEKSQAWIAGAVIGPLVGVGLCASVYFLWRRRRKHHDHSRSTSPKREAPAEVADSRQEVPRSELIGHHLEPAMLHSDNVAVRSSELPA